MIKVLAAEIVYMAAFFVPLLILAAVTPIDVTATSLLVMTAVFSTMRIVQILRNKETNRERRNRRDLY